MAFLKERFGAIISILIIVPLGFYTKFYDGPAREWVNDSLGGLFYEIFWCLIVFLILPKAKAWKIALGVFAATCILEILQLWHPPILEALRSYFIGRTVLGNSFSISDFFYYVAGSLLGWWWILRLQKHRSSVGKN
jgi:hypothetical protein